MKYSHVFLHSYLYVKAPIWLAAMRANRHKKMMVLRPKRSEATPKRLEPNVMPTDRKVKVRGSSHELEVIKTWQIREVTKTLVT